MDSAQRLKASKCIHDHCYRRFPSFLSCITLCRFLFYPFLNSATSALKMPVKFLTKGCTLCILLTLLLRLLNLEKVGCVISSQTSDQDYHRHYYYYYYYDYYHMIYKKQWWMTIWRANNVFKLEKMYRLSSTSCIYRLRYSSSGSSVEVCLKRYSTSWKISITVL